jgi:hypothetical protein
MGEVIAGLGLVFGVYGAAKSARAAAKAAEQARRIGRANAAGFRRLAADRVQTGHTLEQRHYYAAAQFTGRQYSKIAGSGLNANFGSAAQIRGHTAGQIVADARNIREKTMKDVEELLHRARVAKLGGQAQAAGLEAQGLSALYSGIGNTFSGLAGIVNSYQNSGDQGNVTYNFYNTAEAPIY